VMHRHLKQELVPPDHINASLSAGFSQVIEMMMAKDVSQRYQNATDLIEDLEVVARGESPQFAQPTLDFAKLAEVAKTAPASGSMPQTKRKQDESTFQSMLLPLLIASVIVNLIMIIVAIVSAVST